MCVCVLDRSVFPRQTVGESAHPGAESLFQRLGVTKDVANAGFLRHTGICMTRGSSRRFVPFGGTRKQPWRGFQLWRFDFDQILLNRAVSIGARFIEHCLPWDAIVTNGGITILTDRGSIQCQVVVDGTGRHRWLARRWGLTIETFSPILIARYGYREGDSPVMRDNPLFVSRQDGWDWTARVRPNLYQWISVKSGGNKQSLDNVPTELGELREVGPVRGADVTWRLVLRSASSRHFLVGDAAAVLDPSSSHGIIKALSSGILAATCIGKILRNRAGNTHHIVEGYVAWQRNWFLRDIRQLKILNSQKDIL
ncbi:MAG: flavin-dependent dehydrogenase [Edaphobacter sp.]|nr:flavin-dependent dehydrogenase [Edaphobacter sp.]